MRIITSALIALLVFAQWPALAAPSITRIPQGQSFWNQEHKCDRFCRQEGYGDSGIRVWLVRHKDRLCGYAEEQQARPPYRIPGVWLMGMVANKSFVVQYIETFGKSEDQPGEAEIWVEGRALKWKDIKHPGGAQYAYLEDMEARRAKLKASAPETMPTALIDCAKGANLFEQIYKY